MLDGQLTRNAVVNGYTYDAETGVSTYCPENIRDNNWRLFASLREWGNIDKGKHFNTDHTVTAQLNRSVFLATLQNPMESDPYSHVFTTTLGYKGNVRYTKNALTLTPEWGIDYQHIHRSATSAQADEVSSPLSEAGRGLYSFHYGLSGNYTFPFGINLETDITMRSRRGFYDPAMNDNQLLWNATLTRSFLRGGRLTARLRCYDILDNLSNFSYITTAQVHAEEWHNTLRRYILLTLQYKLNVTPKKH